MEQIRRLRRMVSRDTAGTLTPYRRWLGATLGSPSPPGDSSALLAWGGDASAAISREPRIMFDTGEPTTGRELVAALDRLTRDGAQALGALPVASFFAPQGDRWSPAEHARHLRRSSYPLVVAFRIPAFLLRLRFGRPRRASRSFVQLRADYRAALAAGGQAGRFAPPPEDRLADPDKRRGEILTAWSRTNARLGQLLQNWREDRLDAVQLPHPLLGMLTIREMAAFTVYHTAHHLNLVMQRIGGA